MSIKKAMIVIWRWPELGLSHYQIKGEENSLLYTIKYDPPTNYMDFEQEQPSWQQKVHVDMMSIFQRFADEANGVKYLILVHDVSPFSLEKLYLFLDENNSNNWQIRVAKFNGGKGYIYVDHNNKTGLIASHGLAIKVPYLSPDNKRGTTSVVDEQGLIEPQHFNGVWDNYFVLNKNHFEEAYHLISLLPFDRLSKSKLSLRKYIERQNHSWLQVFLKDHNVKESNEVCEYFQKPSEEQNFPPGTKDAYMKLCTHFDQTLNTPDYFVNLSTYFTQLISLLP